MKECIKCRLQKKLSEFHVATQNKDGHKNICKRCKYKYNHRYQKQRPLLMKNSFKRWCESHRDVYLDKKAQYRHDNSHKILKYKKTYRRQHSSEISAYIKQWRDKNKDRTRSYYSKRRAIKNGVNEVFTSIHRQCTTRAFNNRCAKCSSPNKLTIDHFRPLVDKNPLTLCNAIVLCSYCNGSKGIKDPTVFFTPSQLKYIGSKIMVAQKLYKEVI